MAQIDPSNPLPGSRVNSQDEITMPDIGPDFVSHSLQFIEIGDRSTISTDRDFLTLEMSLVLKP